jgi:hypothetical protein
LDSKDFGDYLTFRKLGMPLLVQVLFWTGSLATLYTGFRMFAAAGDARTGDGQLLSIVYVFFGILVLRILCEVALLIFQSRDALYVSQGLSVGAGAAQPFSLGGVQPAQTQAPQTVAPAGAAFQFDTAATAQATAAPTPTVTMHPPAASPASTVAATPLPEPQPAPISTDQTSAATGFCTGCGGPLKPNQKFCTGCGTSI